MKCLLIYFAAVSALSALITVYDKAAARSLPKHRVRERTLMLFGAAGGAAAMYVTMLLIRHKTKQRLMLGMPVLIVLNAAVAGVCVFLLVS